MKYDSLMISDREVALQKGVTLQRGGTEALASGWKAEEEEEDEVCFDQVRGVRYSSGHRFPSAAKGGGMPSNGSNSKSFRRVSCVGINLMR